MVDPELEPFKTTINLRAYAAGLGYVWDRKESWRGSTVMRAPDGDKVIIKRHADGHFVYFSAHRDGDSGSIIDFVQQRRRLSLGAVRKDLRAWSRTPAIVPCWCRTEPESAALELNRGCDRLGRPRGYRGVPIG